MARVGRARLSRRRAHATDYLTRAAEKEGCVGRTFTLGLSYLPMQAPMSAAPRSIKLRLPLGRMAATDTGVTRRAADLII